MSTQFAFQCPHCHDENGIIQRIYPTDIDGEVTEVRGVCTNCGEHFRVKITTTKQGPIVRIVR